MEWQLIPVFVAIGCVVGFLAGLLGIGGAMTMIPVLTVIFGREHFPSDHIVHMAIATSLATNQEIIAQFIAVNGKTWWQVYTITGTPPIWIVGGRWAGAAIHANRAWLTSPRKRNHSKKKREYNNMIRKTLAAICIAAAAELSGLVVGATAAHAAPCTGPPGQASAGAEAGCGTACAATGSCGTIPQQVYQDPNCVHPISPLVAADCARSGGA